MATREQVRNNQTRQPFRPFLVRTNSGTVYTVRHPEFISCDPTGREMVIHDDDGTHFLEMLCVEVITAPPLPAPKGGNGE